MYLIGIGIDAVDIAEIAQMLADDEHFLGNFVPSELEYAGNGPHRVERLAARYAAKEAVAKALHVGWGDGVEWTDVEIVNSDSGAPTVFLRSRLAEIADIHGVTNWLLTLTHTPTVAVAVAAAGRVT
jgi:holo-[acyl-carrier protein] synthase